MDIRLGSILGSNQLFMDLGAIWGVGQVQSLEWVRFNVEIGPGPK